MKKQFILYLFIFSLPFVSFGKGEKDSLAMAELESIKYMDSVKRSMKYETGVIQLKGGMAQLNVPKGFKFLNKEQTDFVVTEIWGNPADNDLLGMIIPESSTPFESNNYAFVVSYDPMGFVKDEDADKIDYDEMLKEIQEGEAEGNKQRKAQGFSTVHIEGWASKPFYDKEKKVLHWAKNIKFEGEEENVLNYDVRVLGRKGILSLVAVSQMNQLSLVKKDIDKVLAMASFTDGNQYKDFDSKIDNVAAWTVGGLVAGKVLAKVGLFAKFWKFIAVGAVALFGFLKKLVTGKRKENEAEETTNEAQAHIDQEQGRDPNVV